MFFNHQSWTKADDIRDFEIEGISVGTSLLKFYNIDQINKFERVNYKKKYYRLYIDNKKLNNYDYIAVDLKLDDNKFIIYGLNGMIDFDYGENTKCLDKQEIVTNDIKNIFKSEPEDVKTISQQDKSGKSVVYNVFFRLDNGKVVVQCYDFTQESNIQPGFDLSIRLKEFSDWLNRLK